MLADAVAAGQRSRRSPRGNAAGPPRRRKTRAAASRPRDELPPVRVRYPLSPGKDRTEVWQRVGAPDERDESPHRSPRPRGPAPAQGGASEAKRGTGSAAAPGRGHGAGQGDEGGVSPGSEASDSASVWKWDGHGVFPAWLTKREDFQGSFPRFRDQEQGAAEAAPTEAGRAPLASLSRAPEQRSEEDRKSIAFWLLHGPLSDLTEDGVDNEARCHALARTASSREAEAGEVLMREGVDGGMEGDGLFYVVSGGLVEEKEGAEGPVRVLGPGACTGAASLHLTGPAASTLRSTEHTVLVAMRAKDFRDTLAWFREQQAQRALNFLSSKTALNAWSRNKLRALSRQARFRKLQPREHAQTQGEPVRELCFVLQGHVELLRGYSQEAVNRWPRGLHLWETRTHRFVRPLVVDEVPEGGHFGEECLLHRDPTPAAALSAVAPDGGALLCFPQPVAKDLMDARILRVFRKSAAARTDSLDEMKSAAEADLVARKMGESLTKQAYGPHYVERKLSGGAEAGALPSAVQHATKHLTDAEKQDRRRRKKYLATSVRFRSGAEARAGDQ